MQKKIRSHLWVATGLVGLALLPLQTWGTPPHALSAVSVRGTGEIDVTFDQEIDETSGTTIGNYAVTSLTVTNVVLFLNSTGAVLSIQESIPANFTVTINNVSNTTAEAIAPNTQVTGSTVLENGTNLGTVGTNPSEVGSVFSTGEGSFDVIAGGADIYNNSDAGYFVYTSKTGDFDLKVKVIDMEGTPSNPGINSCAKTGLLAEEPVSGGIGSQGNRHLYVFVQPTFWEFSAKYIDGSTFFLDPPNFLYTDVFPNAWLRFSRVANRFTSYFSTDGVTWTNLGYATPFPAFPDTLLVGLGTSSHDNNPGATILAKLRQYSDYTYPAPLISISTQPASVTAGANSKASFSVAATASTSGNPLPASQIGYQWQKLVGPNFVNITGARSQTYVTPFLTAGDNGSQYRCVVSIPGAVSNSSAATLTVGTDLVRPGIHHAFSFSNTVVSVYFTEPVQSPSATAAGNYTIDQSIGVSAAQLDPSDATHVDLATTALTSGNIYTLTINGVKDLAGNAIPAATQRAFVAQSYTNSTATFATNNPLALLPVLPTADMLPVGALANKGFTLRIMQETNADFQDVRWIEFAEDMLNGALKTYLPDPSAGQALINDALLSSYVEPNTVNYARGDLLPTDTGVLPGDEALPGLPGNSGTFNYSAVEASAYLQLQAGVYRVGANSTSGHRLYFGRDRNDPNGFILEQMDRDPGGSGTAVTADFIVPRTGLYPMRLMYFDNRRASPILEWFQQDWTTGTLTGINDPSGGIPAFQPPASLQAGSIVASHAANGDVVLNWTTGATLQVANQVTGPYVDIPGSVSPYVQIPAVGSKFYRLRF